MQVAGVVESSANSCVQVASVVCPNATPQRAPDTEPVLDDVTGKAEFIRLAPRARNDRCFENTANFWSVAYLVDALVKHHRSRKQAVYCRYALADSVSRHGGSAPLAPSRSNAFMTSSGDSSLNCLFPST